MGEQQRSWVRRHKVWTAAGVVVTCLVGLTVLGLVVGPQPTTVAGPAAATTLSIPPTTTTTTATDEPTSNSASPLLSTTTTAAAAPSTDAAPVGFTCQQVGGVFVPHGTDGRGDCESASTRGACHTAPPAQCPDYLAELTMTPPFPDGLIDNPSEIFLSSNKDCWIDPLTH